jgi:hypothetical protein
MVIGCPSFQKIQLFTIFFTDFPYPDTDFLIWITIVPGQISDHTRFEFNGPDRKYYVLDQ